jgi:hypothetical protein
MSDFKMGEIEIGGQIWTTDNLDVAICTEDKDSNG